MPGQAENSDVVIQCLTCTLDQLKADIGTLGLPGSDALVAFVDIASAKTHHESNPNHILVQPYVFEGAIPPSFGNIVASR